MAVAGIRVVGDGTTKTLRGTVGDDGFEGTTGNETFTTGAGDDIVVAGGGSDFVYADIGNDWLTGGSGIDTLSFWKINTSSNDGGEAAEFGVSVDVKANRADFGVYGIKTISSFENIAGTDHDDVILASSKDDQLYGNGGNDRLDGREGADVIYAGAGDDTLIGGSGDDVLIGDPGRDRFFAGTGQDIVSAVTYLSLDDDGARDTFIYSDIKYSGTTEATRDLIFGFFDGENGDKIDLSGIDANGSKAGDGKFTFIGSNNLGSNSTSEVQVKATSNPNEYMVKVDIDNDNGSEMQILVYSLSVLTASDFIL